MIINIASPIKKEEIKQLLSESECPKYSFIKNKTMMEMQFEVTYPEGKEGDAIRDTKTLIKSVPWGSVLNLRILEEGKTVSWE